MPHLDVNTLAEYATGGIGAVISALGASVSLKVYDGAGVEKGTGTLANPWATQNGAEFSVNALTAFQVTSTGTPDSNWYLRFEGAGRWVRGSFGLVSSSQEFLWSLANWIAGTPGKMGAVSVSSTQTGARYYVRPAGSTYGAGNGTSYADAWAGFANIAWGSLTPGDTVYVAGEFAAENTALGASGAAGNPLVIASCETRFGAPVNDPAVLWAGKKRPAANWVDEGDGVYSITTGDAVTSNYVFSDELKMLRAVADRAECVTTEDSWVKVGTTFYYNPSGAPRTLYFYIPFNAAFNFNQKSYVTLRGVKMYGGTSSRGVCIVSHNTDAVSPTGITLDRCTVGLAPLRGIHVDPPGTLTGLTVTDCVGFDCGAFFYLVSGQGDQFTITGNEIYHSADYKTNPVYNVNPGDENQIAVWGGVTNLLIDDNYLHDIRGLGIHLYLGETANMQDAVVTNNRVYIDGSNSARYNCGIALTGTNVASGFWGRFSNATVSGNEITGANTSAQANYACGIRVKSGTPPNGTTDAPKITGNTLYDNLVGVWLINNSLDLVHCGVITGNSISNPKSGGYFIRGENGTTYTYLGIDYNTYFGTGKWQWDGGADQTTFAAWKSASGQDASSTHTG